MATNDKGSDLDIFEGLSKKGGSGSPSGGHTSAPPPPPPGAKQTLLGINAGGLAVPPPPGLPGAFSASRPPPPPGRGSLPPVGAPSPQTLAAVPKAAVDVDWDDEDEATHIFDKAEDFPIRPRSAPLPAAGAPPPAASMKSTLLGLTPPPPGSFPPPPARFSPPPPPPGATSPGRMSAAPMATGAGTLPPPTRTLPPPPSATLAGLGVSRSIPPPPGALPISNPPMMALAAPGRTGMTSDRPPARFLPGHAEPTAMVQPAPNRRWAIYGAIAVLAAALIWFLVPHSGRIVINVTDPKGASVGRVDIYVDGRKQCETAPCMVDESAGAHEVKVLADGYDVPATQGINVESRKDSMATFVLGTQSKGTGIKVGGTQPGVKLYVDDKEIGPLPQDYREMSPGDHVVKIVGSERYQPLERRVSVEKDKVEDLGSVTLRVLKGKVTITLATPGARVFLVSGMDRRELPMLPISVDIDTNKTWSLQAIRPGFTDYSQPISFEDGQAEKNYVITLEPKAAQGISTSWAPPPQIPAVNAAPPPPPPAPRPVPQAPAPPPVAAVEHAPSIPAAIQAAGGGGGEGFLNINSIPPSTCYLDGKQLGPTPKVRVSVPAGVHQVKFVNAEQNLTKTVSVSVGAGETKLAVAKLN